MLQPARDRACVSATYNTKPLRRQIHNQSQTSHLWYSKIVEPIPVRDRFKPDFWPESKNVSKIKYTNYTNFYKLSAKYYQEETENYIYTDYRSEPMSHRVLLMPWRCRIYSRAQRGVASSSQYSPHTVPRRERISWFITEGMTTTWLAVTRTATGARMWFTTHITCTSAQNRCRARVRTFRLCRITRMYMSLSNMCAQQFAIECRKWRIYDVHAYRSCIH